MKSSLYICTWILTRTGDEECTVNLYMNTHKDGDEECTVNLYMDTHKDGG
jgi:hypothetical protein